MAFLVCEAGLRVASLRVSRSHAKPPPSTPWRVLCAGDSYVYGLGAEDGRGYPEHLEALLRAETGEGKVSVVNEGVPGFNSSMLLDRLPTWLAQAEPQVLILTVGHNNSWNWADLHVDAASGRGAARALARLRVVQLLRLALRWDLGSPERVEAARRLHESQKGRAKEEKYTRERTMLEEILARHPDDAWSLLKLADLEASHGRMPRAEALRARAASVDPEAVARMESSQRRIEDWHAEQRRAGRAWDMNPSGEDLARIQEAMGRDALADPSSFGTRREDLLRAVLRRDLEDMVSLAREHGTRPIFCGYASATKSADQDMAAVAASLGVPFVDQRAVFDAWIAEGVPMADLFVLDGHCTGEGYRRMAEVLLPRVRDTLTEAGLAARRPSEQGVDEGRGGLARDDDQGQE
jgi:lysophospholipase L1-like esterase